MYVGTELLVQRVKKCITTKCRVVPILFPEECITRDFAWRWHNELEHIGTLRYHPFLKVYVPASTFGLERMLLPSKYAAMCHVFRTSTMFGFQEILAGFVLNDFRKPLEFQLLYNYFRQLQKRSHKARLKCSTICKHYCDDSSEFSWHFIEQNYGADDPVIKWSLKMK